MIPKFNQHMQTIRWLFSSIKTILFVTSVSAIGTNPELLAQSLENWQLEIDKHAIKVFQSPTQSGYVSIKATLEVMGKPDEFLRFLENTELAPKWIDNCVKVVVLSKPNQFEREVRSFFAAPWPVKDRDMITYSRTTIDNKGDLNIQVTDIGSRYPKDPDYVRMKKVSGTWTVTQLDGELIRIQYIGYGEPSGSLPVWLANKLLLRSTFNTFDNLRKWLHTSIPAS